MPNEASLVVLEPRGPAVLVAWERKNVEISLPNNAMLCTQERGYQAQPTATLLDRWQAPTMLPHLRLVLLVVPLLVPLILSTWASPSLRERL